MLDLTEGVDVMTIKQEGEVGVGKGRKSKKRKPKRKIVKLESLKQLNLNAGGLDIGAAEIYAAVPEGRDEESVRQFETFTTDLNSLADWLEACGVDTVAMESTSVYWIPIYEILEKRGFDLYLVNARQVKNVTGRKTDVLDCQWLQQLHTYGLLRGSFRPSQEICELRTLLRHRGNLIRWRAAHIQHMQKALNLMNLHLTNVISDITGVTGMKIVRAIVAGERKPKVLAQYRDPNCKNSEEVIAKSLEGNYSSEHLFVLQQALELYDIYTAKIRVCDAEIEQLYGAFEPQVDIVTKPLKAPKKNRRKNKNAPGYDLRTYLYQMTGVDLTAIDGLEVLTVQTIISEVGIDMSKWKSVKHFTSWLGLAPENDVSAGKILRTGTKKVKSRANLAFRQAAMGASRGQSAMGVFYRHIRARHGPAVAIVATAHKIARIFYVMLKERREYISPDPAKYEAKQKERTIRQLERKAARFGLQVVPAV
jgi:transposase